MAQCVDDVTNIIENGTSRDDQSDDQSDVLVERYRHEDNVVNDGKICIDCQCCERHSSRYTNGLALPEKEIVTRIFPDLADKDAGQARNNLQCKCMCRHLFRFIIRSHMEACQSI